MELQYRIVPQYISPGDGDAAEKSKFRRLQNEVEVEFRIKCCPDCGRVFEKIKTPRKRFDVQLYFFSEFPTRKLPRIVCPECDGTSNQYLIFYY